MSAVSANLLTPYEPRRIIISTRCGSAGLDICEISIYLGWRACKYRMIFPESALQSAKCGPRGRPWPPEWRPLGGPLTRNADEARRPRVMADIRIVGSSEIGHDFTGTWWQGVDKKRTTSQYQRRRGPFAAPLTMLVRKEIYNHHAACKDCHDQRRDGVTYCPCHRRHQGCTWFD